MNTRREHVLLAYTCTHIEFPNVICSMSASIFSTLKETPELGQGTFHISETAVALATNKTTALCTQDKPTLALEQLRLHSLIIGDEILFFLNE